jgi:hypothetical protein
MPYCLEVSYRGMPEWPSPERFEERIEKLLRKTANGMGFGGGARDITWSFRTEKAVRNAAAKVRRYVAKEPAKVYRTANVHTFKY